LRKIPLRPCGAGDQPLAPTHVEEDPPVVAPGAPGPRAPPVYRGAVEGDRGVGPFAYDQVALIEQPLVEAKTAHQRARAVVRDHQHGGRGVAGGEEFADAPVQVAVVVNDGVLKWRIRHKVGVGGVHVLPEGVMHAVGAHIHQYQQIGPFFAQQAPCEGKTLIAEGVDVSEDAGFVFRSKIGHIEQIGPLQPFSDALRQFGRMGVGAGDGRGQEATDGDAVHCGRRVGARNANDGDAPAGRAQVIPQAWQAHGAPIGYHQGTVAASCEPLGQGWQPLREHPAALHQPMVVGVETGEERRMRGHGPLSGAEGAGEQRRARRQHVERG
jgi:hypothetical protein